MEEIFLNTSIPNFKEQEDKIKKEGYVEKKYTRATKNDIEGAFRRHLMKQLIPARGITTPNQVALLKQEINTMISGTLYERGANGAQFMKFKMYVPTEQLRKKREAEQMNTVELEEEEFAPENYGEKVHAKQRAVNSLIKKATKSSKEAVKIAENMQRHAAFPYGPRNQNVKAVYQGIAPEIKYYAQTSQKLVSNALSAAEHDKLNMAENYASKAVELGEQAKRVANTPMNILANMMSRTNFGTHVQFKKGLNGSTEIVTIPEYKEYSPELRKELAKMGIKNKESKRGGTRKKKNSKNRSFKRSI
jgi:transcription antitermination factor NusA-like protein